jgi:hypothetical protein
MQAAPYKANALALVRGWLGTVVISRVSERGELTGQVRYQVPGVDRFGLPVTHLVLHALLGTGVFSHDNDSSDEPARDEAGDEASQRYSHGELTTTVSSDG